MHTFGETVVVDPRTLRPVAGRVASITDALTGEPVETLDPDTGTPQPLVTSSRGYVGQFATSEEHKVVRVRFTSDRAYVMVALEVQAAASSSTTFTISTSPPDAGLWINPTEEA